MGEDEVSYMNFDIMPHMHNRVGLGTFPLASVFNKITSEQSINIVRNYIKNGGYYIDTAPMYGFGDVESLLGKALKTIPREKFYMVTKCGYKDVEGKTFQTIPRGARYKEVTKECEESLKRLNLEFIDLYFVHSPDPDVPFEETMRALNDLQKQGKIKDIGVSNVNLKQLKEYHSFGQITYIQNRFSLINRSIDSDFEEFLLKEKIKLVPYQVIDRGQLTGSLIEGMSLQNGDLRKGRSDWAEDRLTLLSRWSKEYVRPIAQELGITIGQLSMAWALSQKYVGFIIVGLTNPEYISINLQADKIKLGSEILSKLDKAYTELENQVMQGYHTSVREFRGLNEHYY